MKHYIWCSRLTMNCFKSSDLFGHEPVYSLKTSKNIFFKKTLSLVKKKSLFQKYVLQHCIVVGRFHSHHSSIALL